MSRTRFSWGNRWAPPTVCDVVPLWRIDIPTAVRNFTGEAVLGAGHTITYPITIIIGNGLESYILCEIEPAEAGLHFIVRGVGG